jgi:hypothetical protein
MRDSYTNPSETKRIESFEIFGLTNGIHETGIWKKFIFHFITLKLFRVSKYLSPLFSGFFLNVKTAWRRATKASWTWPRPPSPSNPRHRPTSNPRCPTAPSTSALHFRAWPRPTPPSNETRPLRYPSERTRPPFWPSNARRRFYRATRTTCRRCCRSRRPTLRPTLPPRTLLLSTTTTAWAARWGVQCLPFCTILFIIR